MTSYPVVLYVYDLSQGLAKQMSPMLIGKTIEGIWHTGTVVYGSEYFFGGGIQKSAPGASQAGRPVNVIPLGNTQKTQAEFEDFLRGLRIKYNPSTYNLFNNNCNNFSNDVSLFLLGKPIPACLQTRACVPGLQSGLFLKGSRVYQLTFSAHHWACNSAQ